MNFKKKKLTGMKNTIETFNKKRIVFSGMGLHKKKSRSSHIIIENVNIRYEYTRLFVFLVV